MELDRSQRRTHDRCGALDDERWASWSMRTSRTAALPCSAPAHWPFASQARPIEEQRSAAALVATFLEGGIAAGVFAVVDIRVTAALVFHLLHGAADEIAAGWIVTRSTGRHDRSSSKRSRRPNPLAPWFATQQGPSAPE